MDKNKFFLGIMIAAMGLFILISPKPFIQFAVIILGIALIFDGIFILVTVRTLVTDVNYARVMAIHGWLSIVVGALAVLLPHTLVKIFEGIFDFMMYIVAFYLLVAAGMEVYAINILSRNGISTKKSIFEVLVCIILAVVLFLLPSLNILVRVFGVVLLGAGILFSFVQWKSRSIVIQPDRIVTVSDEEIPADAEGMQDE